MNAKRVVDEHGQAFCRKIKFATAADFGCVKFTALENELSQVEVTAKEGAIWENWSMVPCPECGGAGNLGSACHFCAGTGNVRRYDDGVVVSERIRSHPKQLELRPAVEEPQPGIVLAPMPKPSVL